MGAIAKWRRHYGEPNGLSGKSSGKYILRQIFLFVIKKKLKVNYHAENHYYLLHDLIVAKFQIDNIRIVVENEAVRSIRNRNTKNHAY